MKRLITVLTLVAFSMMSTPTMATANVKKGQKIFKKKFRKYCRFSGVKFARNHTQDEWEEIYDDGKFKKEAKRICPRLKVNKIKAAWWEDVYEFSYKYASDGVVPKC
ncbi:MAG: hypothetical protein COB07_11375 [Sulfurovum sp.]|nr:MAG: hypothetical protein COB07_11375 [Sulfurovum sp.]